jgi:octaprenyl-diphosphate synthase
MAAGPRQTEGGRRGCSAYNFGLSPLSAPVNDTASAVSPSDILDLPAIQALAREDMAAVDALIRHRLASDVVLINQVSEYIIGAGGKRLRPMLLLLAAGALGDHAGKGVGPDAHQLAAVIEFIHTATLLHDDVVDESDLRRGRRTANAVWGNAASVLVGDFLYSRSFQLMVELGRVEIMRILADTTNQIAEGEVLQLLHVRNPDTDEAAYLRVIERKTAVLFAAATRLGALLAGADTATCDAMHAYGLNLGYAFQIADDVLDYTSDADTLGKNLGDDLAEGKATLPLIHAMARSDAATRATLRNAVEHGDTDAMPAVLAAIRATGGLDYSRGSAREFARGAGNTLSDNPYMAALRGLARYAVSRDH